MKIIGNADTLNIIRRTLNKIDTRLVDHGERVSYTFYHLLKMEGSYSEKQIFNLCIVALFHDIGAYKTEEIDRLVQFESSETWRHSIYGYIFFKDLSPLSKYADVVLYHHLNCNRFHHVESEWLKTANLLHLADRIDVATLNSIDEIEAFLMTYCLGKQFTQESIELFCKANREFDFMEKIKNHTYKAQLDDFLLTGDFSKQEIHNYLKMVAYLIDFRSEQTVAHTITTVRISVETAKYLGLNSDEIAKIYYGSLLHDIGKVTTPLEVLEKAGKLTDSEMSKMQCHVAVTNEILEGYIDDSIRKIAARHHEKIDGTGYPLGLKEDELTLSEQIVAVTDIMSALTGRRSYKEGFSKEKTISILIHMRDHHKLSPVVVDTVVLHYDEIMKNANHASEKLIQIFHNIRTEYSVLFEKYQAI